MRKLFLHVGVHRTGTTSTQGVLRANFTELLQRGFMYPYSRPRHDDVVRALRSGILSPQDLADDLVKRANTHPFQIQNIILSDEDMSMIEDFNLFAPLAKVFDVKVVAMIRRQDLWLESWYLQNVKWQWDAAVANLSFAEFLARRKDFFWIDYAARFAQYESIFGPGSVLPAVFERAEMPDGPTAAVLRLLGITDPSFMGPEVHQNSSLSPLMSEFVRHLPLHNLRDPDRRYFELAAMKVDEDLAHNGSKLLLSHEMRAEIMAEHEPGNREVAQKYFDRQELFREPLPALDASLADRSLPAQSDALMADFVVPMIMALGRQFTDQRERMEQIQRSMEEVRCHAAEAVQVQRLPLRA